MRAFNFCPKINDRESDHYRISIRFSYVESVFFHVPRIHIITISARLSVIVLTSVPRTLYLLKAPVSVGYINRCEIATS